MGSVMEAQMQGDGCVERRDWSAAFEAGEAAWRYRTNVRTMRVSFTLQELHDVEEALAARERVLHTTYVRAGYAARSGRAYEEWLAVATLRDRFDDLIDAMREGE
jgi:hypothetical protein